MRSQNKNNITLNKYWQKADEQFALAEKKNIVEAISKSDTEKFYQFTRMMRITNTLKKAKISANK